MRVQPGYGDARLRQPPATCSLMSDAQSLQNGFGRHRIDGLPQGHVHSHQHGFELLVGEHHAHGYAARDVLQNFGMSGKVHARGMQRRFVDGRRHHGGYPTREGILGRGFDARIGRRTSTGVHLPDDEVGRQRNDGQHGNGPARNLVPIGQFVEFHDSRTATVG